MILGKYELKKRLGKGSYGEVMLAEDKKGNKYAIKIISLKSFTGQNQYLLEYLESQIKCLKQMNSQYVMKLFSTDSQNNNKYLICQYCDGGDIISVQAKQPNKVFPLQKASEILSFVIKGLEALHQSGFVHRDIKAQNILMKTQNGKQVYKLSDFGFTKNIKDISFTILGTGAYMSPQIYNQDQYGFQIDMWAFGILFYFMLNMEFPFKPHLFPNTAKKSDQLKKAASNFSYKKYVQNTRKKIMQNCTDDVQDLFKKMLNPNTKQRVNFHDIRNHAIFKKYFPQNLNTLSQILYKSGKKANLKNNFRMSSVSKQQAKDNTSGIIKRNKQFLKQNNLIQNQKSKIQFLKEILTQIHRNAQLSVPVLLGFTYNIQKYEVISLKKLQQILTQRQLKNKFFNLNWKDYCKTQQFQQFKKDLQQQIYKAELQLDKHYMDCQQNLNQITVINKDFKKSFEKKISNKQFDGEFKKGYRKSTILCYEQLIKRIKKQDKKGNIRNYHLTLITICHAFNKLFETKKNLEVIFQDYFKIYGKKDEELDYSELKSAMASFSTGQLNAITKAIIDIYFVK